MRLAGIVLLFLIASCASTKPVEETGFEIQLNESKPNSSAQANIEVRALHSDGKPVEGLQVMLMDSKIEVTTNRLGIAKFSIADALFKDHLKIKSAIIPIDLRGLNRVLAIVID
jgi:hypothetical protein